MLLSKISQHDKFYLYGAQVVAYGAYRAIKYLIGKRPVAFLVGSISGNPSQIDGIAVTTCEKVDKQALIIVAVTELLQGEIVSALRRDGFDNLFLLTAQEEHRLMTAYFARHDLFPVVDTAVKKESGVAKVSTATPDFVLYEVCNYRDKPVTSPPNLHPFEIRIQAGAALTKERIASLTDDTGQNISDRNKQYCEMSAVYWIWKNRRHDWVGIEHYRRHLLVTPDMLSDEVDAILPLPYMCYSNTLAQFRRFVGEDVVTALLKALQELHPSEYPRYLAVLEDEYQYTYNLLCSRWSVFDDYCAWFFHITEYMESMADEVADINNTRALSYVAEVLTNLYFRANSRSLRLRHVEKGVYV